MEPQVRGRSLIRFEATQRHAMVASWSMYGSTQVFSPVSSGSEWQEIFGNISPLLEDTVVSGGLEYSVPLEGLQNEIRKFTPGSCKFDGVSVESVLNFAPLYKIDTVNLEVTSLKFGPIRIEGTYHNPGFEIWGDERLFDLLPWKHLWFESVWDWVGHYSKNSLVPREFWKPEHEAILNELLEPRVSPES